MTNNFKNFVEAMIIATADQMWNIGEYTDSHDGKTYDLPNVIGFQVRGGKIRPVYVSKKYSFSVNPFIMEKGEIHLDTASCGGTVMVSKWGSLEKATQRFNMNHAYDPENKDRAAWTKEYLILVRKDENGEIHVDF